MRADLTQLCRRQARVLQRRRHRAPDAFSARCRGVTRVAGQPPPVEPRQRVCVARLGMCLVLQHEKGCSLAQDQAATVAAEWTARVWGEQPHRVEPGVHHLRQRVGGAGQHDGRIPVPDALGRPGDGARPGGAGRRKQRGRPFQSEAARQRVQRGLFQRCAGALQQRVEG